MANYRMSVNFVRSSLFYCYALNFIYRTTRKNHYSNHTVNERTYLATNE